MSNRRKPLSERWVSPAAWRVTAAVVWLNQRRSSSCFFVCTVSECMLATGNAILNFELCAFSLCEGFARLRTGVICPWVLFSVVFLYGGGFFRALRV